MTQLEIYKSKQQLIKSGEETTIN